MTTLVEGVVLVNGEWVRNNGAMIPIVEENLGVGEIIRRKKELKKYIPVAMSQVNDSLEKTEVRPCPNTIMVAINGDGKVLTQWGVDVNRVMVFPKLGEEVDGSLGVRVSRKS